MLLKKGSVIASWEESKSDVKTIFNTGNIIFNANVIPSMKIVRKGEVYDTDMGYVRVHLYLFVLEDGCKGEFIIGDDQITTIKAEENFTDLNKLVACTNVILGVPKFSKKFINSYVFTNKICSNINLLNIQEVLVVYEETNDKLTPKVSRHNVIYLGEFKDCYTGEEVVDIIKLLVSDVYENVHYGLVQDWINDHV